MLPMCRADHMTQGAERGVYSCVFVLRLIHFKHRGDPTSQHLIDLKR